MVILSDCNTLLQVDGSDRHRKGSMAVERNVRNEVSCGVENADIKESGYSVVHGQRQIVPLDGDSSLTAENGDGLTSFICYSLSFSRKVFISLELSKWIDLLNRDRLSMQGAKKSE